MKGSFLIRFIWLLIALAIIIFLLDFFPSFRNKNINTKRALFLKKNQQVISVAAVMPEGQYREDFKNGIELARRKINSALNMPFSIYVEYYEESKTTAKKIARDVNHMAVLGYSNLKLAPNAGMIFTESNLLFFHFCTNYDMQNKNLKRNFSVVPSDNLLIRAVIDKLNCKNLTRPYVIVSREKDYNDLQSVLYPNLKQTDINVINRFTYMENDYNFDEIINDFKKDEFDSIIFVGRPKHCLEFIDQLRDLGFIEPVFIPEKFGNDMFENIHSIKEKEELMIFRGFTKSDTTFQNQEFLMEYFKAFNDEVPGMWAAYAYESLMVLCDTARKIKSKNPLELANYLYFYEEYHALVDTLSFNRKGVLDGRTIYSLEIKDSKLTNAKKYILE